MDTNKIFEEIKKIRNDNDFKGKLNFQKSEIKEANEQIQKLEDEIKKKHEKEFKLIKEIKELMDTEKNHEDNLICNELLKNKKKEYDEKKEELFNLLEKNAKSEKENREKILEKINKIEKSKEEIQDLYYIRNGKISLELEKTRYKILIKFGCYLYDNEKNKTLIDIINEERDKYKNN